MKKIILYICLAVLVPINFVMAECCPAGGPGNYVDACIVSDKEGNPVCTARYYKNGNLKEEVHYKEKQIDGVSREYYENGNLKIEINYIDGKRNGTARTYFENGQLKNEVSFLNDEVEGIEKSYYQNGNLRVERNLKSGKIEGEVKVYYENGNLKSECSFKAGKPDWCKTYELDGKLKQGCPYTYKDGKPDILCMSKWKLKKIFD